MWHIVSDSCCDLHSLEGGEGVVDFATIPFSIRIGDREYIDDGTISVEEMLTANENHSEMAQTACPAPGEWREKFEPEGPVLAFTISVNSRRRCIDERDIMSIGKLAIQL